VAGNVTRTSQLACSRFLHSNDFQLGWDRRNHRFRRDIPAALLKTSYTGYFGFPILFIPLEGIMFVSNTKNRRIRSIDELTKFTSHGSHITVLIFSFSNILRDTYNTNNIIFCISACRRVDQQASNLIGLCSELQLIVTCFVPF
jgi:hypothetical protein